MAGLLLLTKGNKKWHFFIPGLLKILQRVQLSSTRHRGDHKDLLYFDSGREGRLMRW
jgi:hypothetical protein